MDDKKQLLFNAVFDIYKLFIGAGLTLLVAVILKIAFSEGSFSTGLILSLIDIIAMFYLSLVFGSILYDIYKSL
ncbi:hypothetical protein [Methanocaldococcus fervens]|uniref:Uncharacterized protein n=1 Tax=Methanocaldococcus fervens (strain DSM 4213 / JCM 15782 / AG86) TaxID=573064 RepID=C7P5L4_METFA|nr:hypothetical protein [Methanocaldococcus fervens]ACV23846.1 hypothetical protein Mefer_0004 [Methanocaldococcus fervens AG86]